MALGAWLQLQFWPKLASEFWCWNSIPRQEAAVIPLERMALNLTQVGLMWERVGSMALPHQVGSSHCMMNDSDGANPKKGRPVRFSKVQVRDDGDSD